MFPLAALAFLGSDGAAGGGIYFAASAAATERKAQKHGVILVADVYLGRSKEVTPGFNGSFADLLQQGYDSVILHGFSSGIEYVIFNFDQAKNIREGGRI